MSFWFREIFGWFLVVLGLVVLFECMNKVRDQLIIEAGALTVIGIVLFRGGIHLLKVAVAARICREARRNTWAERAERREPPGAAPPRPARVTAPAGRLP
jgi:hypothetical protein